MQHWEELIYERLDGKAEGLAEGRQEGWAESKIDSIFEFLSDLGIIPEDIKALIQAERDENLLRKWLRFAANSDSFEEFREKFQTSMEQMAG